MQDWYENLNQELETEMKEDRNDWNNHKASPIEDFRKAKDLINKMTDNTKETNPKDAVGSGKPTYANVPVPVLYEIGAALLEGARKYGGYNWRVAGVRTQVYLDAARRHLDAWWEGEDTDPDSGLSHITKAIAGLVVLRDAQINGMVQTDDRPPSCMADFMLSSKLQVQTIIDEYPDPVHSFTQAELVHKRQTAVRVYAGDTLGFDIEVMIPSPDSSEGFIWAKQGSTRQSLDQALAVAQALRDDGYSERVVKVTRISDRIEEMADGAQYVAGQMREQVTVVFPGDPSLMEATEEEVEDFADHGVDAEDLGQVEELTVIAEEVKIPQETLDAYAKLGIKPGDGVCHKVDVQGTFINDETAADMCACELDEEDVDYCECQDEEPHGFPHDTFNTPDMSIDDEADRDFF